MPSYTRVVAGSDTVRAQYDACSKIKRCLSNPWVIAGIIATAVAVPVAIHNAEDGEIAQIYAEIYEGDLAARMEELLLLAGMPTRLSECGVGEDSIPALAEAAAAQWTANFNPRPVGEADFAHFYRSAI